MPVCPPRTSVARYLLPFQSYKRLDNVRIVQGLVTAIALEQQRVVCRLADGTSSTEPYDVAMRQLRHRFGTRFHALLGSVPPRRAVRYLMLIGACDPLLCPIWGFRRC